MSSFSLISAVLTNECACCFLKSGKTTKKNDSYLYKDTNLKDADKQTWLNKNTLIKTKTEYCMYKNIKEIFAAAKRAKYKKKVKP